MSEGRRGYNFWGVLNHVVGGIYGLVMACSVLNLYLSPFNSEYAGKLRFWMTNLSCLERLIASSGSAGYKLDT